MRKTGPSSRARFCKKPAGSRTNARVSPISGKENRPGNSRSGRRGFVSAMRVVPRAWCTATARDCPAAGTGVDAHAASMKRVLPTLEPTQLADPSARNRLDVGGEAFLYPMVPPVQTAHLRMRRLSFMRYREIGRAHV